MSGQSHHDFEGLHRIIQNHLDKTDRIESLERSIKRLKHGISIGIPSVWIQNEIEIMRQDLLRLEGG